MAGDDRRWMRLALALGARGQGRVWPNPSVGCVIVKNGRVLGRGVTQPGGRPHAEPEALAQAGEAARGATAYVTLEPCNHYGQTPPCSEALIRAGLARVVIALRDPDPRTDGSGAARLASAGIAVTSGVCEAEARHAHRGFLSRVIGGRPALTLKLANSFDGRIATATGESQWITGPAARRHVHGLRARHDAVMVGAGTARADDPMLTVRDMGVAHQPVRVILSRHLDLPRAGKLAQSAREVPLWLLCGEKAPAALRSEWEALGARCLEVPTGPGGQLDLAGALDVLGREGLTSVFCEGGGALAASLLGADLVDDLIGYSAGLVIGAEGQPSVGALGLSRLAEAPRFALERLERIGPDVMQHWSRDFLQSV